jgi:hypothetical protein
VAASWAIGSELGNRERGCVGRVGGASGPSGRLDVHPRVAMQILRHSKIAITMEMYTEVMPSATREALRKLSNQLGP